jgi:hypothetical protein
MIQLAWFYKPPAESMLPILRDYFDTFILTKTDESTRDTLRELGVQARFLQYLRFDAIHHPGSCSDQPNRNQVADQVGDLCRLLNEHPDWFLRDASGNLLIHNNYLLMDPGNQEWRAYWLERARRSQEELGWDGVFLDNVEASLSKRERLNKFPVAYPNDATYQEAIVGFLQYIYTQYFQPRGRPLLANIIAVRDREVIFRYLQYLDGMMDEAWTVGWNDNFKDPQEWEDELQLAEDVQAMGKQIILVAQGSRDDVHRQQFAFASYLLINWGKASFRYAHQEVYDQVWLYSNYELDLGEPLGPRYRQGNEWIRDFTNGQVRVNPVTLAASIITK